MNTKINTTWSLRPQTSRAVRLGYRRISVLNLIVLVGLVLSSACRPTGPAPAPAATPTPTPSGLPVKDNGQPLPPQVVEQRPAGGQELPVSGVVELVFNQAMNTDVTGRAWQLIGPDNQAIQGQVDWPSPNTLRFKPAAALKTSSIYHGLLDKSAASQEGVALADALDLKFQTVGDLQVSQVFPLDGTTEVANNAVITAIFNHPVVPLVTAEERDKLPSPLEITPEIKGRGEWVNTSVYAFQPEEPLKGATNYKVTVKAGLSDASQETQLAEDFSWQFTTITPRVQSLRLSNGAENPQDFLQNVLLDEYFTISFFQPMDVSASEAVLSLTPEGGKPAELTTNWNTDDTQVIITPTQRLELGTTYTLNLDASAQSKDGGSLEQGLSWTFTTVPEPSVVYISPPEGQQGTGYNQQLYIKFASPMNIESVKKNITITPKPEGEIQWWYDPYDWSISAFVLQPSTRYEVRAQRGMQDIYGNSMKREHVVRFTNPAAPPQAGLQMPWEPSLLRVGGPQEFYITYRNIKSVDLSLSRITPQQFIGMQDGSLDRYQYKPQESDSVWNAQQESKGKLNELVLMPQTPVTGPGRPLEPGFYFLSLDSPNIPHPAQPYLDNRQLIVASANLTLKSATTQALMWLTDLKSGLPLKDVELTVYDKNFKPLGKGRTDADGLLELDVSAPQDPYEKRYAMTSGDGKIFAFASSEWGSGANLYDYGLWSSYYAPANQPKVYVYTERPIYRPNQPVYFKGIVRLDDDLSYSLPAQRTVHVKIDSYKETVYEADLPLSEGGTFDGQITLDPQAVLGFYNISVFLPDRKDPIGGVGFTVAEYRKPEYQVKVSAEPSNVLAGKDFTVSVGADYYSGGGVGDAQVDWTLNATQFYFSPSGEYSAYSFSDDERDLGFYEGYIPPTTETVAQGQGRTDADGKFTLTLPADLSEAKTSREFTFEATVTDISKNAVSGRATIVGHRSAVYPGIRPHSYVGTVGQEQSFDIVALDWDYKPIAGQKVTVDIVERKWYSVQEQDATGRVQWKSTVEEEPVTSVEVTTDERGEATASFTPSKGGVYRARVTALDESGNEGRASGFLWVSGLVEYIPWRQTNDRSFDLIADRTSYNPGDKAEILIASPFQGESYALVTVERGHIFKQDVVHLTSNSTVYKVSITPDLAPNAYVSVVVVKGIDETNPRPNFKMGVVEVKVDTSKQKVNISISADPSQAGPGDRVTYTVNTQDDKGQPVDAEVSLGLSDLATLSLVSPNSMPILDFFYDHRTLGVWTTIPLFLNLEDYNATIQEQIAQGPGMGSGGGKGEGEFGVVEVRQNFPDTAFWEARLQTGEGGQAQVTVTLPDNLTTWRMDARAVTQDTRVGQATLDLISTRPLLVRPQTPRFFVAGDHAQLGAAVNNNTDQPLSVQVSLQTEGVELQGDATRQVDIEAKRQAYVSWVVTVNNDAKRVDLIFSAEGGGYKDASRPPQGTLDNQGIPVYRYEARETVGTSGQMTEGGTRIEAISLPTNMEVNEGSLTVNVAPSLAAGMTDGLSYLEHFPYECVEQTISRFLPNVITTRALKSAGLSDPTLEANLETQVNVALQRLVSWQNPDGGWGWWPGADQKSDPLTSAYVVLALVEAKAAGYTVSADLIERGMTYVNSQIQPISRLEDPSLLNRQAFLLFVLARAGRPNVSASVQLFDQRQNMAIYARAFLARTLYVIFSADPRLKTLLSDFASSAVTSATGSHWEEKDQDPWNWNTDTRTTAIVLSAMSELDKSNPLNANAVRWLMNNRSNGHWLGTQETAWSLMGLTDWMENSGELQADYQYAVALNGKRLGGGTANRESLRETLQLQISVADMLKYQANRLAFARDDGTGNLYYTAHLDVSLPVDEVPALDQGIIVSRSYYHFESDPAKLANAEPVPQATQGELLLVRLTLVAPHALHYVLVEDPLPAGLEAVDQSLDVNVQNLQVPQTYSWEDVFSRGWGWWFFEHTQLRDEKVVLSASYLPAGTYVYTYLARASTPGLFYTIPPTAQELYFPEVYGRGDGMQFVVNP